jgi:hypothetical protein
MPKSRKKTKAPKHVLALPDLEQAKSAVLNTLTKSGRRTYDHAITQFVEWYCSEPRLAFNRTVVLRYRISLGQRFRAVRGSAETASHKTRLGASGRGNFSGRTEEVQIVARFSGCPCAIQNAGVGEQHLRKADRA